MKKQGGFTLIELVAVLVILAILAVTAVPQFVDLRDEARQAATDGVAGALSSASTLNYAVRSVNATSGVAVTDCTNAASALQGGATPAGYTITAAAIVPPASANCTLTGPGGKTSTFVAIGIN
jgi:MSHA pilin protein MshA